MSITITVMYPNMPRPKFDIDSAAAAGAADQRQERRQERHETSQAQRQQANAAAWDQSYRSCLLRRGYVVTP